MLRLSFRGKSGRRHEVRVDDARVTRLVRRCQQLPGQELFQFVDADGLAHGVGSGEVNDYLEAATGERFTAKDFRTWHGSAQALALMCEAGTGANGATPPPLTQVVAEVARRLGNTAAVCRKSYIHPAVLALGADGVSTMRHAARRRGLGAAEWHLLHLLEQRAKGRP